jgi:transcriptional regulator with XRE-family HTH domain
MYYFHYICTNHQFLTMSESYNRLKIVLAEKQRTNKWLAEQLGKDPTTVSKWCTNRSQPSLEVLYDIATCLDVEAKDLLI